MKASIDVGHSLTAAFVASLLCLIASFLEENFPLHGREAKYKIPNSFNLKKKFMTFLDFLDQAMQ